MIEQLAETPVNNQNRGASDTDLSVIASFLTPIAHLLADDEVTEIMGNQDGRWFYEAKGMKTIQEAEINYPNSDLLTAMTVISNMLGKPFTEESRYSAHNCQTAAVWQRHGHQSQSLV